MEYLTPSSSILTIILEDSVRRKRFSKKIQCVSKKMYLESAMNIFKIKRPIDFLKFSVLISFSVLHLPYFNSKSLVFQFKKTLKFDFLKIRICRANSPLSTKGITGAVFFFLLIFRDLALFRK